MTKETVKHTPDARFDAVRYLTGNGTKIVQVDSFLEANRPSEGQGFLLSKQFQTHGQPATAKKGFTGTVTDTQTGAMERFTIREDYDYKDGRDGKGYHVNLQCGREKLAFVSSNDYSESVHDALSYVG